MESSSWGQENQSSTPTSTPNVRSLAMTNCVPGNMGFMELHARRSRAARKFAPPTSKDAGTMARAVDRLDVPLATADVSGAQRNARITSVSSTNIHSGAQAADMSASSWSLSLASPRMRTLVSPGETPAVTSNTTAPVSRTNGQLTQLQRANVDFLVRIASPRSPITIESKYREQEGEVILLACRSRLITHHYQQTLQSIPSQWRPTACRIPLPRFTREVLHKLQQ